MTDQPGPSVEERLRDCEWVHEHIGAACIFPDGDGDCLNVEHWYTCRRDVELLAANLLHELTALRSQVAHLTGYEETKRLLALFMAEVRDCVGIPEDSSVLGEVRKLAAKLKAAEAELHGLDAVLARRPALENYQTRREKVEQACFVAGQQSDRANTLERKLSAAEAELTALRSQAAHLIAERNDLRDRIAERLMECDQLRGERDHQAIQATCAEREREAAEAERDTLRAERDAAQASLVGIKPLVSNWREVAHRMPTDGYERYMSEMLLACATDLERCLPSPPSPQRGASRGNALRV